LTGALDMKVGAACLRFFGPDLDPAELEAKLGSPPSNSWNASEAWLDGDQLSLRGHKGWILNGDWSQGQPLEDQIETLLGALNPDLEVWTSLTARHHADIFCGVFLGGRVGSSIWPARTLQAVSARGLSLNLCIFDASQ